MNYIEEALQRYNMSNEKTEFLRHNENMTVRVGENFLLRIHKPAEGFSAGYMYEALDQRAVRCEELKFLSYLHGNGMKVQTPVKNRDGDEVTVLADGTLATILSWLPGRTLEEEGVSKEFCVAIGSMLAKFHRTAKDYIPETILNYDAKLCNSLKEQICMAGKRKEVVGNPLLKQEYFRCMEDACMVIAMCLEQKKKEFFPVHTDLSLSNMLITEGEIIPIDFSLFGYGHPMMDLGALFCSRLNSQENRKAVAEGYQSAGGSIDFEVLDCCFALNVLLGIGLHIEKWIGEEWFPARLERWCREMFAPLGNGKKLFSEDFYLLNIK